MSNQPEFTMPAEAEELWLPDSEHPIKVQNLIDFDSESSENIGEVATSVAFKLCDDDPLCIVEQQNFDNLTSVVRCFHLLESPKRRQLLDALCSSLTCLSAWIDKMMSTPADSQDRELLSDYRGAFKAYLFFLQWISKISAREVLEASTSTAAATSTASQRGGARSRKKAADDMNTWDWPSQCGKVMKTVAQALNIDLWALFRPNRPDQTVMLKLIHLASASIEMPAAAKDEDLASGAIHILAVCAVKYQQLDDVAAAMVDCLNKYEHTPSLVAELMRYCVSQYDDGRLAAAVLGEIAAVDPAEYERQQNATGEKAGVRSIASFVEEITEKLPRLMANQIALLLPHLGGKSWTLRSGIVTAIGILLHKAFESAVGDAADAQGAAARLRSKQHLLDILCERIRDQSSFTRKAVLQTWQYLAENRAIPLGHWHAVTDIATGRLEDKSSLVRKEALRLLGALMLHNPFGPSLPMDRFAASLSLHKAMLDQVMPPETQDNAGADFNGEVVVVVAETDADDATAAAAEGAVQVKAEPIEEDALAEEPTEAEATIEVEEGSQTIQEEEEEQQQRQQQQRPARSPAEVGWDGSVEELQALVASLELAVDFARSLSSSMPTLVQLLASSTVTDVQESVAMLLTCKQFEVAGAPEAIRKMLPLVFARDQAVKDRIVEALDQLYITGWAGNTFTSAQAARNLIDLASGANLGELGSLEVVVKEFMQKGFLTPVTLHELWDVAGRAATASSANAQGAGRARRDLRAALAVLAMAAATEPDAFAEEHVRMLLQYGFAVGAGADALTMRNACLVLQRLASNFANGLYDGVRDQMYAVLTRAVVASPFSEESWFTASEAALTALYSLHPAPEHICGAIVRCMASQAFVSSSPSSSSSSEGITAPTAAAGDVDGAAGHETPENDGHQEDNDAATASRTDVLTSLPIIGISQFFFVLGHVALQQLVLIERLTKSVRRARFEAEKKAAEDRAERTTQRNKGTASNNNTNDDDDDINAELGVGSVAADAELDAMKDACESQILSTRTLLGPYACIISAVCHNRALLFSHPILRSSALLALSKLMIIDARFCESNLQLLFTLLQNRSLCEAPLRCNLVIALGDLALRFPNLLEPWTDHIYRPLGDPDAKVRKNAMMVLTHLILNDMMKVKGHIAKMAVCLEDSDDRIAALAQLFFHELAKKEYKGTSPIYNLLPDILSNLSRETALTRPQFQSVMQQLLGYIKKDKQGDALVEKLCQRFASTDDAVQWRNVAFCLAQLPLSEKGVKKLSECFKLYKTALADAEVTEVICGGILAKAKKNAGKPELKQMVEELEAKIEACAAERAEEEEAAAAAAERAQQDRAKNTGDSNEEGFGGDDMDRDVMETSSVRESGIGIGGDNVDGNITSNEDMMHADSDGAAIIVGRDVASSVGVVAAVKEEPQVDGDDDDNQEGEEERQEKRVSRSKRSSRSKTTTTAPPARSSRGRTKASAVIEDSDGDDDEAKIAAVQAGIGAIKVEDDDIDDDDEY